MEVSLGKIKNTETQEILDFQMNPSDFQIRHELGYQVESLVQSSVPVVNYKSSGPAMLQTQLHFDLDLGAKEGIKKVLPFLKSAQTVQKSTHSVPTLEFHLGSFRFAGYLRSYRYFCRRFDSKGEAVSVSLDFEMISNGSFEEEGSK